jgi:hypothetical protein
MSIAFPLDFIVCLYHTFSHMSLKVYLFHPKVYSPSSFAQCLANQGKKYENNGYAQVLCTLPPSGADPKEELDSLV